MYSMTGYGRGARQINSSTVIVEIKSINSRGMEITLKCPGLDGEKELELRNQIKNSFHRGRFDIIVKPYYENKRFVNPLPSDEFISALIKEIKRIKRKFNIGGDININSILQLLTFTKIDEITTQSYWKAIKGAFSEACKKLKEARKIEGEKIRIELEKRARKVRTMTAGILKLYPVFKNEKREKFLARISPQIDDIDSESSARIEQEFSLWLEKRDFSEELERLRAHLKEFEKLLKNVEEPKGKKMDFFLQEMLREATTLATKVLDHRIVKKAVEIKAELERMREQVQNIE